MRIPFYLHNIGEAEIQRVTEVLRSPILTTGELTKEFETRFSEYLGLGHTVGVTSCTAGMFLSLKALGIGPGDEVITTPLSFIATANIILEAGARPVFVDVEPETGNLDAAAIQAAVTPATRAILPVHLYGQMADMRAIAALAQEHRLAVVEDCAHAIESVRDGVRPGELSDTACFSFYATKNITSAEGGAISTRSEALAQKLKILRLHGMSQDAATRYTAPRYKHYDMETMGYKCNMDNLHAALLLHQLELIEERLARREALCQRYEQAFSEIAGIDFPKVLPNSKSARHLFTIWVDPERRDTIMWALQERGIGIAVNFRPIHLMKYYRESFGFAPGMFPVAESIGSRTITLPLYPLLSDEQADYVIAAVREVVA